MKLIGDATLSIEIWVPIALQRTRDLRARYRLHRHARGNFDA